MDSNPLAYLQERKLGACQIRWLNELALFNLQIYHLGRSNKAADTFSHCPKSPNSSLESGLDRDVEEAISYGLLCYIVHNVID